MEVQKDTLEQLNMRSTKSWRSIFKGSYMFILLFITVIILSVVRLGEVEFFARGHFLNWDASIVNLLRMAVPILTLIGGFTLIIISGHIDLSVGSSLSLCAVVFSYLALNGFNFGSALIITMILGIILGFVNGFLIAKLRITPVIATLITLSLYKGLARLIVPPGVSAIKSSEMKFMPAWINNYGRVGVLAGLPVAFFVAVSVIILMIIIQKRTTLGKYTVAIGGNMQAAELSGINVVRTVWYLYVITGFCAALAGVARASYMSLGDPLSGDGMEFDCLIATLLGGTNIWGGEGSIIKAVVGALIIMCISTGLMTVLEPYWILFIKGAVLLFAVTLSHLLVRAKSI